MSKTFAVTRRGVLLGAGAVAAAATGLGRLATPANAAAPMLGASRPSHYRFTLGEFEVTTLFDGALQFDGPHPIFGNDQPAEEVQQYAAAHALPTTRQEIAFTPTVVNTGRELVLFDTGNGEGRRGAGAGRLLAALDDAGYSADQVDIVVITHGHPDHIGGLTEDGEPAFPNARYVVGEREHLGWKTGDGVPEVRKKNQEMYLQAIAPFEDKMALVKPDGEVTSGIRAVNCYGHSQGMLGFHIESNGRRVLIWADTANHYIMSVQRPEWHVAFDHDREAGIATRKRIFDMVATDQIPVIGYHMPPPAVGFVEKVGDGYRWMQASYHLHL